MSVAVPGLQPVDAAAGFRNVEILDCGVRRVSASACAFAMRQVLDGHAPIVGIDRNATCYQVPWAADDGAIDSAIVKVIRVGAQRTNPDTTFAGEAAVLAQLPTAGIANAPQLLARVRIGGSHFLLMTRLGGIHPDPVANPLRDEHLAAIIDSLLQMDRVGLLHYDLKPANILVDGNQVGFVDFEFSRFEPWQDAFAPATQRYCDDFNVSANPHFPARSNVANFEFRCLARYCLRLGDEQSAAVADGFLRRYLRQRARYHALRADWLDQLGAACMTDLARRGGIVIALAKARCAAAASLERMLAGLLLDDDDDVVAAEAAMLQLRRRVFEKDAVGMGAARADLSSHIERHRQRDALRGWRYAEAMEATGNAVMRSTHRGRDTPAAAAGA